MDLGLSGKVAVITGASRGLGFATAQALAGEGCTVVMAARGLRGAEQGGRQAALAVGPRLESGAGGV